MIHHFYLKRRSIEKVEMLVNNLHDKVEYVIHIRNLKEELNHGLVLKKFIKCLKSIKVLA